MSVAISDLTGILCGAVKINGITAGKHKLKYYEKIETHESMITTTIISAESVCGLDTKSFPFSMRPRLTRKSSDLFIILFNVHM